MSGVEKLSDHLTMLRHGETVLSGATTEIRESFGRTEIYIESPVADADLLAIDGVLSVEPQGIGRQVRLTNAEVGRQVFSTVAQDGYVPVFAQTAPTLDEIFRREVQGGGVND